MQYLTNPQVSGPQGGIHIIGRLVINLARQGFKIHVLDVETPHLPLEQSSALVHVLFASLMFEPRLNLGACPRGAHVTQVGVKPIAAWPTLAGGQNFDLNPRLELIGKRYDAAVHFRTATTMAHFS